MNDCEKFNETSLPETEDFYSHLNMEDITDAGYVNTKKVCKDFEIQNLGKYHFQSDTLMLANAFENFRNMCIKIYELEKILSAPGLARQAVLKETNVKLDPLTDIDVINGRKRYKRRNMSFYLYICKS